MPRYEPELGQLCFGQPFGEFAVSEYVEAVLSMLDREMDRVWGNNHDLGDEYESPFENTGSRYETPVFSVHAYSWGDEEQPWNFKWGDTEISWYKYLGRGMSANMEISPDVAARMLDECLAAIRAQDSDGAVE